MAIKYVAISLNLIGYLLNPAPSETTRRGRSKLNHNDMHLFALFGLIKI